MAASDQWYAVFVTPASALKTGQHQYHIVQLASKPAVGSTAYSGVVFAVDGPFPTQAAAEAAIGATGTTGISTWQPRTQVQQANQPPSFGGLAAIGDFFGRLTEASTWVRVGEVVLGLILLAVGVARITHAVPIATKIAKTAGAVGLA